MARDYKNSSRSKKKPETTRQSLGILPFLTGLSLGLFVAFFVYLQQNKPDTAPREQNRHVEKPSPQKKPSASSEGIRPRFDFYTILPETEVKVPEWEPRTTAPEAQEPSETRQTSTYILQVGSFQKYDEADRVKAKLALLGIQAEIQRVVINGQDVWFRVRVGPLNAGRQLEDTRTRLSSNGMDSLLLKIRD